jgi:hypothetical protein
VGLWGWGLSIFTRLALFFSKESGVVEVHLHSSELVCFFGFLCCTPALGCGFTAENPSGVGKRPAAWPQRYGKLLSLALKKRMSWTALLLLGTFSDATPQNCSRLSQNRMASSAIAEITVLILRKIWTMF